MSKHPALIGLPYDHRAALEATCRRRKADEAEQAAFIAKYEALMTSLVADEMVVFSDAVHPEHQSRPAHGWLPKGRKIALKATSGRKRLNIQGALDLETFQFTFAEGEKINAQSTRATHPRHAGKTGAQQSDDDDHTCPCRQCPTPPRQVTSAMVDWPGTPSEAALPACTCPTSQPDRAPVGRHA